MRARVNLVMNNWGEAATDAEAALSGYTFLSKDDVSAPGFNSANSPSWIWHKYKDSREQFERRTHKRLIDILNPNQKTVEALMSLDLPAGVEIEIKL